MSVVLTVYVDSNSLPMAVDLEVFPRVVRIAFLVFVALFVGFLLLAVLAGLLGAWF